MYKCDRCGKEFLDAYNITKYFNGATSVETVCLECIKKIGKADSDKGDSNGTEEN